MAGQLSVTIEGFASDLAATYTQIYGEWHPECSATITRCSRLVLARISACEMPYHNVEHTMLVTTVGQQVLIGKHRSEGSVTPEDWQRFTVALLCHDIGYVRGVCRGDANGRFATGEGDDTVTLPEGSTDAALTPYHVSRSRLFVRENYDALGVEARDVEAITADIEMTRFPPPRTPADQSAGTYGGLVRAADFIGQFGDPNYLRKLPALFVEFEQVGANEAMGYRTPDDMRATYATFFRDVVEPHLQDALRYLRVTPEGERWIASLQSHLREVERGDA